MLRQFGENRVRRSRPDKRLCLLVMMLEIFSDRVFKIRDTRKGSAPYSPPCNLCKEPFDLVEPARTRRREVNMKAWMACKPALDGRRFMRSIVVENEMNLLLAGDLGINTTQKLQKLLVPMAPMTRANNLSGLYVECGKERRHAVTQVVVRLPLRYARAHWENRLSAIERLHLRFFIDAEDDRVFRRRHVETNDVTRLFDKEWVGRQLESFRAMRLETEGVPYAHDRRLREARFGCQFARSPMRRALGTRRQRFSDNRFDKIVTNFPRRSRSWRVAKALQSIAAKT